MILSVAVCFSLAFWLFKFAWPIYQWEGVITSPDKEFSLVVLREDVAASADFSYHVYCFEGIQQERAQHEIISPFQIWLWSGNRFYEGYQYDNARWVDPGSVEIQLAGVEQSERVTSRSYFCGTKKVIVSRTY